MHAMEFLDCNVSYGLDAAGSTMLPVTAMADLDRHLGRAGVAGAVVWRTEQHVGSPVTANAMLADDLRGREHLHGLWTILPPHTHEVPEPEAMPAHMQANRIIGWRIFPQRHRYLPRAFVLRDWLQVAVARRIPLFVNTAHGTRLEDLHEILTAFPDLTVVLTYASDWPSDRAYRPFVKDFANVYIDLTFAITDGGIESFVGEYGSSRLLYGSGFPHCYLGANMLMVRHAEIPAADRTAIAGGNLARIIREVRL